jgi:HK97 family phage major capsid protein
MFELHARSNFPSPAILETKDDGGDDPVAAAIAELTTGFSDFRQKAEAKQTDLEVKVAGVTKLSDRLDKIEAKLNRPDQRGDDDKDSPETKAFDAYVRGGVVPETKALNSSDAAAGGVLAPGGFEAEIIRNVREMSPVRQAARVSQMSTGALTLPKRTGVIAATWVAEGQESTESEPTYGAIDVAPQELATHVDVSQALLDDAAFNLEAEIGLDLGEAFGVAESAAFIAGDGVANRPLGIINDASVPLVATGDATGFDDEDGADGLIDIFYSLKTAYSQRASWLMSRRTMSAVRKMRDSDGRYVWQPALSADAPPTILGRPVIEAPDLPDLGAGNISILFGDFGRGYRIFDRTGLSILRDPYTLARKRIVRIHASRRVTGKVVLPEAIVRVKCATSI